MPLRHLSTFGDGVLPWTKSCFVCGESNPHGLRLRSRIEGGAVVLDYTTRKDDLGWRHIVHGGILMTLLDEVMTWAAILASGRACVAAEMTSRLREPVEVGQSLRVEARVAGGRNRLILTEGRALDETGKPVATATGKYMPMPQEQVDLCARDFVASPDALDPAAIVRTRSDGTHDHPYSPAEIPR